MDNVFEALEEIGNIDLGNNPYKKFDTNKLKNVYGVEFATLYTALTELKQIKESNPSEALETIANYGICNVYADTILDYCQVEYEAVKQELLNAQEHNKVLEIIKNKCLYTDNLNVLATCVDYNYYKERMSRKHDTEVVKIDWNDRNLLDYLKLLKEEEFDLLKRWQNGQLI